MDLLRAKLAEAEAERDELRGRWDPNAQMPPMPEEEQALYDWLQDRHTNLRDVLEFGTERDSANATVADGAAKLAEFMTMAIT